MGGVGCFANLVRYVNRLSQRLKFQVNLPSEILKYNANTEPEKVFVRGLVNFVPAVAYLFCLKVPAAFSQPRAKTFFGLCKMTKNLD